MPVVRKIWMNSSTGNSTMNSTAAPVEAKKAKRVAKKTEEAVAAPAVPVVTAPAVPVAAAVAKKVKKAAAPAVAAVPAPVVVAAPAAPSTDVAVVAEAPQPTVAEIVAEMTKSLTTIRETITAFHSQLKKIEKRAARDVKDARKRKHRAPAVDENGNPKPARQNVFSRPNRLSDDLCVFLGLPKGSEKSRSEVTTLITNYVKENNLKNKHEIKADGKLRKLLTPNDQTATYFDTQTLTYFNLQRYLNKHYIKTAPAVVVAAKA